MLPTEQLCTLTRNRDEKRKCDQIKKQILFQTGRPLTLLPTKKQPFWCQMSEIVCKKTFGKLKRMHCVSDMALHMLSAQFKELGGKMEKSLPGRTGQDQMVVFLLPPRAENHYFEMSA